jgi:UDP-N-acetylmuramate--alanine ligase
MSGIAEILQRSGYRVTGSDLTESPVTRRLKKLGVKIFKGHEAGNIAGAEVAVYSAAVPLTNPEITAAEERQIPVLRRADMLGQLMRMKYSIAVSGTHGKTTTTSMIGNILAQGGLDPTVIVGGIAKKIGSGAVMGSGSYLVVEADEFDRSFLKMPSTVAVMTTLEAEHLDCYANLEEIKDAFVGFGSLVPFFGCIVLCHDEDSLKDIIPRLKKNVVITYGFSPGSDYRAVERTFTPRGTAFRVEHRGEILGEIELNVPGDHNVKNAMAGVAVGVEMGVPFPAVARSLKKFEGLRRRFEIKGEKRGVMVVDDYAHHPTEICVTLKAAKDTYRRNIIAIFQPHLYSRTRDFCREFGGSFFNADSLIVTDVYAAREKPLQGVSGKLIADAAEQAGHSNVKYLVDPGEIVGFVKKTAGKGDLVITLGAGDVWKTGEKILKAL